MRARRVHCVYDSFGRVMILFQEVPSIYIITRVYTYVQLRYDGKSKSNREIGNFQRRCNNLVFLFSVKNYRLLQFVVAFVKQSSRPLVALFFRTTDAVIKFEQYSVHARYGETIAFGIPNVGKRTNHRLYRSFPGGKFDRAFLYSKECNSVLKF